MHPANPKMLPKRKHDANSKMQQTEKHVQKENAANN